MIVDQSDKKRIEKTKYTDLKERELRTFLNNTIKEQSTLQADIDYYRNEIRIKK
jgi:hypothetical protein